MLRQTARRRLAAGWVRLVAPQVLMPTPGKPAALARAGLGLLLLFALWSAASVRWSANPFASLAYAEQATLLALLTLCTAMVTRSPRMRGLLASALCLSLAASAGAALLAQPSTAAFCGPWSSPAALGAVLTFPAVLLTALLLTKKPADARWPMALRIAIGTGAVVCLVALFLTKQRIPLFATTGGIALWGALRALRPHRSAVVAALVCALAGVLLLIGWQQTSGICEGDCFARHEALAAGSAALWRGGGGGAFAASGAGGDCGCCDGLPSESPRAAHATSITKSGTEHAPADATSMPPASSAQSEPLQVFAELGLPGLLLWLGAHVLALVAAGVRAKDDPLAGTLAAGTFALLVAAAASEALRLPGPPWVHALALGLTFGAAWPHGPLPLPPRPTGMPEHPARWGEAIKALGVMAALVLLLIGWARVLPEARAQAALKRAWILEQSGRAEEASIRAAEAVEHARSPRLRNAALRTQRRLPQLPKAPQADARQDDQPINAKSPESQAP